MTITEKTMTLAETQNEPTNTSASACPPSEQNKFYLSANDYLHDVWRLAAAIRKSGWRPDVLIALWRGGAPVGIAVHEFFRAAGWDVRHMPLKCSSYSGIGDNHGEVRLVLEEEVFSLLKKGERVLVVDDVFDTGKTAETVLSHLEARGFEARLACVYLKSGVNCVTDRRPAYIVRDLGPQWLVFPHEIVGLSSGERAAKDPLLTELLG